MDTEDTSIPLPSHIRMRHPEPGASFNNMTPDEDGAFMVPFDQCEAAQSHGFFIATTDEPAAAAAVDDEPTTEAEPAAPSDPSDEGPAKGDDDPVKTEEEPVKTDDPPAEETKAEATPRSSSRRRPTT